jgi:hypothetical protein
VIPNLDLGKLSDREPALLSSSLNLMADKLVIVGSVSWPGEHGAESATSTVTCLHSAHYDALNRTLGFVPDPNSVISHGAAVPAGPEQWFQRMVATLQAPDGIPPFSFSGISCPAGWRGRFHLTTAGLNRSSIYLKGQWS